MRYCQNKEKSSFNWSHSRVIITPVRMWASYLSIIYNWCILLTKLQRITLVSNRVEHEHEPWWRFILIFILLKRDLKKCLAYSCKNQKYVPSGSIVCEYPSTVKSAMKQLFFIYLGPIYIFVFLALSKIKWFLFSLHSDWPNIVHYHTCFSRKRRYIVYSTLDGHGIFVQLSAYVFKTTGLWKNGSYATIWVR